MEEETNTGKSFEESDSKIESRAKKRVRFRIHLFIYLIAIAFFWMLWFFLFKSSNTAESSVFLKLSWAITLFWALILLAHYMFAIRWNKSAIEKEVARLRKKEQKLLEEAKKLHNNDNNQ